MKLKNLKFQIDQLTLDQLQQEAYCYIPFYGRKFKIMAVDHLDQVNGKSTGEAEASPVVLIVNQEPS